MPIPSTSPPPVVPIVAVVRGRPGRRCVVLMNQSSWDHTLLGVRPSPGPGRGAVSPQSSQDEQRKRSLPGSTVRKEGRAISNSADGRSVTSKLAAILKTFSTGNVHSLSDIARSANLPVSTAHRLTAELAEWGFLERTDDKRYRVGTLVTNLGTRVWHEPNLQEHAR